MTHNLPSESGHPSTWEDYVARMESRLRAGQREYGDRSFDLPPGRLLSEIQEELLDVSAWAYIMWCRLERTRAALSETSRDE